LASYYSLFTLLRNNCFRKKGAGEKMNNNQRLFLPG